MSLDELIKAANQLDETDLDRLLQQVVVLRTQRKAHVLSAESGSTEPALWPEAVLSYQGVADFPAFESYREELLPVDEQALF